MNTLPGISFYDALSRLSIGLLIFFPLIKISYWPKFSDDSTINLALFILTCYLAGFIISFLFNLISSCKNNCVKFYFYKNDLTRINKLISEYDIDTKPIQVEGKDDVITYWNIYYCVQKNGLLGNVPYLEALSAFFLNFGIVGIIPICTLIKRTNYFQNCLFIFCFILAIIFIIFCWYARYCIENTIYTLVISAYKFLTIEKNKEEHKNTNKPN